MEYVLQRGRLAGMSGASEAGNLVHARAQLHAWNGPGRFTKNCSDLDWKPRATPGTPCTIRKRKGLCALTDRLR